MDNSMTAEEYRALEEKSREKKMVKHHERALQIHVVNYIRSAFPQVRIVAAVPNGGSRNPVEGKNLKAMGVLAGFPDLVLYWIGGHGVIEMKRPGKGKVEPHQRAILDTLTSCGVHTAVCNSLPQVEQTLRNWGLIPTRPAPRYIAGSSTL